MASLRWFVASFLVILPALAAASPRPHARLPGHCRTEVSFLGFSRNERTLALRTVAHCPRPDQSVDELELVELLDAAQGQVLATFQQAPAWNVAGGQRSLLSRAELVAYYAAFARAQGPAAWQKIRRRGLFAARRHDFADASVRLRVEGPAQAVRLEVVGNALQVAAPAQKDLRLVVTGRLADGTHVDLAKFAPAGAGQVATLTVYHSAPGHRVALLWHAGGTVQLATYNTPADLRFAHNTVGAVNVLNGTADEVETLYKAIHPTTAKAWDDIVGDLF